MAFVTNPRSTTMLTSECDGTTVTIGWL
jgi:hypothetical protein